MMTLFKKKSNNDYTVVIGCGRLGSHIANTFSDSGENILIIDISKESFRKLSPSFGGLTLVGDATDLDILTEAKMDKASNVIIVTNVDTVNIMIAQLVREYFNVPKIICRLYNPDYECVYQEFSIDTIYPSILSAEKVLNLINE